MRMGEDEFFNNSNVINGDSKFDRLKINDPVALITHLYYSCMLGKKNETFGDIQENDNQTYCPRTFDGWLCWEETAAGRTARENCPDFIVGFDPNRIAYKSCLENGSWFVHPGSGREWSNYTNCVDSEDFKFRQLVNDLYVGGYSISLITLVMSLCIFFSFRTLKCTRIRIHINLFISLALSCLFWMIWYKYVVGDPDVIKNNSMCSTSLNLATSTVHFPLEFSFTLWCKSLHIVLHYLMLVNYFWMFCEGLHLHLVLVIVFIKDAVAMRWFFMLGWILPTLVITLYASIRSAHPTDTEHCWMGESNVMWFLNVPVCISLLVSLMFLINVVRVLLTKLHSASPNPAPLGLRKATRATLILIPLFGLQHILLPFRPDKGCHLEKYYQIASAILISLQGTCVSCLFCFANHDVIFAVKCYLNRLFPGVFGNLMQESFVGLPATQSRDVVV